MPSRRQVAFIGSVAVAVAGAVVIWFGAAAITGQTLCIDAGYLLS